MMFSSAFNIVISGVSACFDWFNIFVDRIGFGGILLTLFTIYTICRLLLSPIIGYASSDFASRSVNAARGTKVSASPDGRIPGQQALPSGKKR